MTNRGILHLSGGEAYDSGREATFFVDALVHADSDSDDSAYAISSSSSSDCGSGSSTCASSLSSSDGYLHAVDSCCQGREGSHYERVNGDWERRLPDERSLYCHAKAAVSVKFESQRTRAAWSSLLCGVSSLLAACSLSSLATCIAVTGFSLSYFKSSQAAAATASAADGGAEREDIRGNPPKIDSRTELLVQPPPADLALSQGRSSTQREAARRYSWDCIANAGSTRCRPVQKEQSPRVDSRSSAYRQISEVVTVFRALADGMYHVSAQMAGTAWLPPPTLLRAVVTRVKAASGTVNVTAAHVIAVLGGGDAPAASRKGAFSVFTAAATRLSAGDELQAQIMCIEEPDCVVHVNGTASYLTVEWLW